MSQSVASLGLSVFDLYQCIKKNADPNADCDWQRCPHKLFVSEAVNSSARPEEFLLMEIVAE